MAAAVLGPLLLFLGASLYDRDRVLRETAQDVTNTVNVLYEHALKVFETQLLVIERVDEHIRDLTDPAVSAQQRELHDYLAGIVANHPQINALWILGEDGSGLAASDVYPIPPTLSIADRDYYKAHLDPNAGAFVEKVTRGRLSGVLSFSISRRRKLADDRPGGIVLAAVTPEYFQRFYATVAPHLDASVALFRSDGAILAREPSVAADSPPLRRDSPLWSEAAKADAGRYETTSSLDGVTRIFAYRKLASFPVYVVFGIGLQAALGEWYRNVAIYGLLALLAAAGLVTVTRMAMRRARAEVLAVHRWQAAAERVEAEMERRVAAEAALRQAQKMEAIGQMTGGVAHDFNNLLTVVIGNLDLALRAVERPERLRQLIDGAQRAAARGATLTQQLLAFARRQMLNPVTVNPNRLIQEFLPLMARAAGEAVQIETRLDPALDPCRIDPGQFEAAMLNLIVNARDAMPGGGRIVIETRNRRLAAGDAARLPELAPGTYVAIAVSDTGTGMAPDVLAKAFDPFFTTKDVGAGSGLGLSQVYGFVKQSGGHVELASEPGHGLVVTILLPCSAERIAAWDKNGDAPAVSGPSSGTVLVVEDNEEVLALAVETLNDLGYQTMVARSGPEALRILEQAIPIDLLFTDVVMPQGMSGEQLAGAARRLRQDIKVLLTSGYTAGADGSDRASTISTFPFLSKPYRRAELAERVRRAMAGGAA
jgi:two-component system NtrC family sensor kinase